ncbi:hypothetical protein [Stappia sp.]|uniref:hypothetical protein n=1 Tax=Stappia sp. TaxID=1870903 RepID=UPI0032D928B2
MYGFKMDPIETARRGTVTAVAALALLGMATAGVSAVETLATAAGKGDRETFLLPEDRLAVTLGTPAGAASGDEEYAIWVGEVELRGRKTVWVELIDRHGEVIYDSEVAHNETHLLPDGRAVVVRALLDPQAEEPTAVAKTDQSRVAPDARLVVTRRVVDAPAVQTAIEFIEEIPREEPREDMTMMMRVAAFGERVWAAITGAMSAAADGVAVAWAWITQTLQA